jgi:hypothetical protein
VLMVHANPVLGLERMDRPALYVRSRGREMPRQLASVFEIANLQISVFAKSTARRDMVPVTLRAECSGKSVCGVAMHC